MGLSWNATQLIIPVSFVEPVAREHNWNPAVLMDSAHTAEGEWTASDDWSWWLNDTKTRTRNAIGKDKHQWKCILIRYRFTNETASSLSFFLIRRAKHARKATDHARDWKSETSVLVSHALLAASMLVCGCTPLTKSEKKKSLIPLPIDRISPTPIPYPIPRVKGLLAYFYCQNSLAFFVSYCFVFSENTRILGIREHLNIPMRTKFSQVITSQRPHFFNWQIKVC